MNLAKKTFAVVSSAVLVVAALVGATPARAAVHAAGTNVVDSTNTVYFIDSNNVLRPYTSAGAFLSYGFNSWASVVPASAEDLALTRGSFVAPRDGSLIRDQRDHRTVYLMTNGQAQGFANRAAFDGLGYNMNNVLEGDVSFLQTLAPITTAAMAHPVGTLILDPNDHRTVYLMTTAGRMGIPSLDVFNSWGYSFNLVANGNSYDMAMPMNAGIMPARVAGQLNPPVNGTVVIPPVTGSVSVSAASDMPASGTLVAGQATADLAHFTFNGSGAVTSVQLKRIGVSSDSALQNVYLYQGNTRLTDAASVTTGSNISFSNPNGLFTVSGPTTISVRGDVATTSQVSGITGQTVGVQLVSAMSGSAAVSGTPVSGNISTVSGASTATVSVGANTVTGSPSINAGSTAQTVWSAPVTVTTRAVWLKSLSLREIGSAPTTALTNYGLYVDGNKVATSAGLTMVNGQNYVMFDLGSSPYNLNIGSHTVEVRADFVNGATRTVQFSLQNAADMMVTDSQLNVNITASGTVPNNAASITIGNGSVTISSDPSFGTVTNVTGGAANTPIARFQLKAYGEDIQVNSLTVAPSVSTGRVTISTTGTVSTTSGSAAVTGSGTNFTQLAAGDLITVGANTYTVSSVTNDTSLTLTANASATVAGSAYSVLRPSTSLNNVSLYVNGNQVGSTQNYNGSTALTYNLGSSLIIPAGQTATLEIRSDLINAANLNYTSGTVGATINAGSNNAQGRYSGTLYSTPSASSATSLTVGTAALTIATNNAFVSQNAAPNTQNVKIGSFVLQSSNAEAIRVTSMSVGVNVTGAATLNNLSNLKVFINGAQVGSTVGAPTASNSFSPNVVIPASGNATVDVYADLGTVTSGTYQTTLTVTSIGQNSNQTSTSSAISGQTMTLATATFNTPTLVVSASTTGQYVAAGTSSGVTDATTATFNFTATSGTATVNELRFAAGTGVTAVKVGGVTAPVVGGTATVTGLSIAVPNGAGGVNVPVTVSYSPVGATGVASGTTNAVTLNYVKYTASGTTSTITPSVAAPTMTLVASKPTLSVNTTQQTGLILGAENKIGEVTVTADAQGNISIGQIKFNVGAAGLSAGPNVSAARIANGTTTISGSTCTANAASNTASITCVFSPEFTISAGTSQTFSLFATFTGTVVAGAQVSVSTSVDQTNFLWTDVAGNGTASARTGTAVYNFPTGSYSVKQ